MNALQVETCMLYMYFNMFKETSLISHASLESSNKESINQTMKLLGGYIGFTEESSYILITIRLCFSLRRLSVGTSRILCPLCSTYSFGWIHFIFIHPIKQLQKVCRDLSCLRNSKIWIFGNFYPRPVLASGYCRWPCPSISPSVRPSPVQARITKFGPKMQNTLVKVPIVLGGNQPWPSRSNLRSKSKFTPFWACPHHNSSPIQDRITKFGPEVQNTLVKIPIVLGGNWPRPSRSNLT